MTVSTSTQIILTSHQFFEQHQEKMVKHFLYLREQDRDYAIEALYEYKNMASCPFPEIHKDVKVAFDKVKNENISSV